jgi:hypothetical protein
MVHDKEEDVPPFDEWKTLLMQDFLALKQLKGQVLVAGGLDSNYNYLASAELYTP